MDRDLLALYVGSPSALVIDLFRDPSIVLPNGVTVEMMYDY